jgi:exocyst complex component 7
MHEQDEYNLLLSLAPLPAPTQIQATYSALLSSPCALLTSTLSSLIALVKRSLHRYTFLALSTLGALQASQPRWMTVLAWRTSKDGMDELRDSGNALKALVLRSFPEFLADVKAAALGSAKGGELSTNLADVTLSVSPDSSTLSASIFSMAYRLSLTSTASPMLLVPLV